MLTCLRGPLKQLNSHTYADIYTQQSKARKELNEAQTLLQLSLLNSELQLKESICREHCVRINHSAISLMKQQSKAEWIRFGDECSRLFMARIKQRKANASIYFIKGQNNQRLEGFEAVSRVLTDYYKELLGSNTPTGYVLIQKLLRVDLL